jgi:hypothetical protein
MKKMLNLCSNTLDDWIARSSMNLTQHEWGFWVCKTVPMVPKVFMWLPS